MLKKAEIEKVYTEKCMEYMMKGYRIDLDNANVSWGNYETAMVMSNDEQHIAISLKEVNDWRNGKSDMVITVETVDNNRWHVFLGGEENEVLETTTYYGVAEGVWSTDCEASEEACKTRWERREAEYNTKVPEYTNDRAKATAVKVLKNHAGYKRVKVDEIDAIMKNRNGYRIFVTGKKDVVINF